MTQFITVNDNLSQEHLLKLQETINRYAEKPGGGLMGNLLHRTRMAEKQVADLREQISDAKADADNSYQGLIVERAEHRETRQELNNEIADLRAQLERRKAWHEETQARLEYVRRQLACAREETERRREDEAVSVQLDRTVTDLPF